MSEQDCVSVAKIALVIIYLFKVSVVLVSGFIAFLGYKLYLKGFTEGRGEIQYESKIGKFIASGHGPGFLFMSCGTVIIIVALCTSGYSNRLKGNGDSETRVSLNQYKEVLAEKEILLAKQAELAKKYNIATNAYNALNAQLCALQAQHSLEFEKAIDKKLPQNIDPNELQRMQNKIRELRAED